MIRIIVVDDHVLFRKGMKSLLATQPNLELAAEAGTYWEAMDLLRRDRFDLAMVDLSMPGRDGLDLIESIRSLQPRLPILVLTAHAEEEYAARALRAGAKGFLTKDVNVEDLVQGIVRVASGRTCISPRIAENVAVLLSCQDTEANPHSSLSNREYKVFERLAEGRQVTAIARELNLSVKTVSTYKVRLLKKMHLQNQADLVRYALFHRIGGQGAAAGLSAAPGP